MAKQTRKYVAALDTAKQLGSRHGGKMAVIRAVDYGDQDELYGILERNGYSWDHKSGKWEKFETPKGAPKTGQVDIRVRAALGDAERATKFIGEALQAAGFNFTRLSPPDPDDRDGPAVTARVYMSGLLPEEK